MSDTEQMTRCPHCSTTFRVTDEQLSIANGVVRCGACLQVFYARSYFVQSESLAFSQQAAGGETAPSPIKERTSITPSKAPSSSEAKPTPSIISKALADSSSSADLIKKEPEDTIHADDSAFSLAASSKPLEQKDDYDEAWAEELLKELENDDADLLESLDISSDGDLSDASASDNPLSDLTPDSDTGSDKYEDELDFSFFERELNNLKSTQSIPKDIPKDDTPKDSPLSASPSPTKPRQPDQAPTSASTLEPPSAADQDSATPDTAPSTAKEDASLSIDETMQIESISQQLEEDEALENSILIQDDPVADQQPDEPEEALESKPITEELSNEFLQASSSNTSSSFGDLAASDDTQAVDESWAKSILEELEEAPKDSRSLSESDRLFIEKKAEEQQEPQAPAHDEGTPPPQTASFQSEPEANTETVQETESSTSSLTDLLKAKRDSRNSTSSLADLDDDEFELISRKGPMDTRQGLSLVGWGIASALAICTLFAQYLYVQFDTLSLKSSYRPLYERTCQTLGCTLPDRIAVEKIINKNLVIRKHPDLANALLVDTIMVNEAPFDQPFPDMTILFSNINNQPIAYRRFKPEEYKGDLGSLSKVPSDTPIHISLEIVDPGAHAINYAIGFRSATAR